jgi:hypothetical protein
VKFFHNTLLNLRRKNRITNLKNSIGEKLEKHEEIETELINHFSVLLKELD